MRLTPDRYESCAVRGRASTLRSRAGENVIAGPTAILLT